MDTSLYILLVSFIILSAFFSASETAFSSVKIVRLKKYAEENKAGAKRALYVAEHFDKTLTTILVGNNIVNLASPVVATIIFSNIFGDTYGPIAATAIMTIIILIFGEILPKSIAKMYAEKICLFTGTIIYGLGILLTPISIVLLFITKQLKKVYKEDAAPSVTEDELMTLIDTIQEEGVLEQEESNLIRSAISFDDISVDEIRTPRTNIVAVDVKAKLEDIVDVFLTEKFSRIPVYEDSIDNIIGILYERDLFGKIVAGNKRIYIKKLIKEPLFVSKSMKVSALLEYLQKNKAHLAVVLDEYGGTSGLVTLEDAIEELVGDIWDEHDDVPELVDVVSPTEFIVEADYDLEDFFDEYLPDVAIPECDYPTIGGWIYDRFEKIAEENEVMDIDGAFRITILENINHRIGKVKIEYIQENENE